MPKNHFRSHFSPFQINTQPFLFFFSKWPSAAMFCRPFPKSIELSGRAIGYIKYEIDGCISDEVMAFHKLFHYIITKWLPFRLAISVFQLSPKSIGFFPHYGSSLAV